MKQTQIEPKSTLEIHHKKPAKNQMVMRCKIILLKQAIQRAEMSIREQIGTTPLKQIEFAIGYLIDAKFITIIALQDGFINYDQLCRIMEILVRVTSGLRTEPLLDAIQLAIELNNLMPPVAVKHGIPQFVIAGGAK